MIQFSTIIVSYNTFEFTRDSIISAQQSSPEIEHEIIVIDNHSPDKSGARLLDNFGPTKDDSLHIVELETNRGFAAANNVGAAMASGEVLFFLNPDTLVKPGAVAEIYRFIIDRDNVGAVGPHVVNTDGSDQESISSLITVKSLVKHFLPIEALFRANVSKQVSTPKQNTPVDVVKGCAIAMRRKVFQEVGGWDESYFLYSEERELCHTLLHSGYQNYFLRSAQIVHIGGASTSQENYANQQIVQHRSTLQFLRRHHGRSVVILFRLLGILGFGSRGIIFWLIERFSDDAQYRVRGSAARSLFRWFLLDYPASTC